MNPRKFIEFNTNLLVAQAEEYLGRESSRRWFARSNALVDENNNPRVPWDTQPVAERWCIDDEHPYYPQPPDQTSPDVPYPPPATTFTYFYVRATMKPSAGGVIELDDDMLVFATQAQTLSDGSSYGPIDFMAEGKTLEQLSVEAQAALQPPPGDL